MRKFSMPMMNADHRGGFWPIAQSGWAEVNYAETHAGKLRGNHFHKENYELFFIIDGEVEVTLRSLKRPEPETVVVSGGEAILLEPYELHTFYSRSETRWIVLLSTGIDEANPDFYGADDFEKMLEKPLPQIQLPEMDWEYPLAS